MARRSGSNRGRRTQARRRGGQDDVPESAEVIAPANRARGNAGAWPRGAVCPQGEAVQRGKRGEEERDIAPRHEQIERSLTRLGKVAQDWHVSKIGQADEVGETGVDSRGRSSGLALGDSTKRSSPVRKSRAVEKEGQSDDKEGSVFRYASPGRNLTVVRVSPVGSGAPPSKRSSFQMVQGLPGSIEPARRSSSSSPPRDLYDEEEESVGERATLRQLYSLAVRGVDGNEGARGEKVVTERVSPSDSVGEAQETRLSVGDKGGGTPETVGARRGKEGEEGGLEGEKEEKKSSGGNKESGGEESESEESESEESESEESEESSSSEDEGSSESSSAVTSPRLVEKRFVCLNKAVFCKKEFDR